MDGEFTPIKYSKPRFENKVKLVQDQMKTLSEDSDQFFYSANRSFLFPQRQLDKVISELRKKIPDQKREKTELRKKYITH